MAGAVHIGARLKTKEAVELGSLGRVFWSTNQHLLEPIGCIPPAEADAEPIFYRKLASLVPGVVA